MDAPNNHHAQFTEEQARRLRALAGLTTDETDAALQAWLPVITTSGPRASEMVGGISAVSDVSPQLVLLAAKADTLLEMAEGEERWAKNAAWARQRARDIGLFGAASAALVGVGRWLFYQLQGHGGPPQP